MLRLLLLGCLFATPAAAEMVDGNHIVVIDGDTIGLPCQAPKAGCSEIIRLTGIDTPRIFRPDCDKGLKAGLQAKAHLALLMRSKQIWVERSGKTDKFKDVLANLRVGGPQGDDVGTQLVHEGLALEDRDGAIDKAQRLARWCTPTAK